MSTPTAIIEPLATGMFRVRLTDESFAFYVETIHEARQLRDDLRVSPTEAYQGPSED